MDTALDAIRGELSSPATCVTAMTTLVPKIADPARRSGNAAIVELRPVGDGRSFCRALVRSIVRRELISAGLIADPGRCEPEELAG